MEVSCRSATPLAGSMTRTRRRATSGTESGLSVVAKLPLGSTWVKSNPEESLLTSNAGNSARAVGGGAGGAPFLHPPASASTTSKNNL